MLGLCVPGLQCQGEESQEMRRSLPAAVLRSRYVRRLLPSLVPKVAGAPPEIRAGTGRWGVGVLSRGRNVGKGAVSRTT